MTVTNPGEVVDEDSWWSPDPPTFEDRLLEHAFERVRDSFREAARHRSPARAFSEALCCLEHHVLNRPTGTISVSQQLCLLDALGRAYRNAQNRFPSGFHRRLDYGVLGAGVLIEFWRRQWVRERDDALLDAKDYTRCLRNDLHTFSLVEEIAERRGRRGAREAEARMVDVRRAA